MSCIFSDGLDMQMCKVGRFLQHRSPSNFLVGVICVFIESQWVMWCHFW